MPLNKCFPCLQFQNEEDVTKLDCSNTVLSSVFPNVWQYERTLEELHLTSTHLNTLPPQLFYCQSLRILIVNNNSLESVPNAIGSLRHLQHLNLSRNLISYFPDSIKSCKNLTYLDLSCNNLQRLPDAITCLISLQELLLNETYLEFLPANFGRLINLKILELRLNNLITLPKSMARLKYLQRIDIGGNEFTELPEVIGELVHLQELWIDFNQIRRITPNIAKLRELQHFEANGNIIELLPNEISNWCNVEVISICTNNLEMLPFSIGMLNTLVTLKCESNDLRELPDSISNLENLEELVVSHNQLKRLPATIGMLRKLRFLFADGNALQMLPNELCSCSTLSVLSISRNRLTELPQNIGHLTCLKVLNLVNNYINTLPVSLLSLVNLTSLWISDNQSQPLVPLQYVDVKKRTQLTCFMLPQNGVQKYACKEQKYKQQRQPNCGNIYGQHQQKLFDEEQPPHQLLKANGDKMNVGCTNPTRHICFAEKATILSATPQDKKSNISHGDVSNIHIISSSIATTSTSFTTTTIANIEQYGARLLRSPTPYPKELRLMAKYVRNTQKHNPTTMQKITTTSTTFNGDRINILTTNVMSTNTDTESTAYVKATAVQTHKDYFEKQQQQQPTAKLTYYQQQQMKPSQHYEAYQHDTTLSTPCVDYGFQNNYQVICSQQQLQQEQEDLLTNYYRSNNVEQKPPPPPLEPPPYHIARVFTKKTPEDLTNFETMRNQHHHQYTQEVQQQQQQIKFALSTLKHNVPMSYKVQEQRERQEAYSTIRSTNATNSVATLNGKHDVELISNFDECAGNSIQNNYDKAHSCQNYDFQNNLTPTIAKQHLNDEQRSEGYEQQQGSQQQLNGSLSQLSICSGNSYTSNDVKNNTSNTMMRSTKKAWLFGSHRNPTVKQITMKWENYIGFDIDEMPNNAGIYISYVASNSNAGRMLCLHDKLLEIDGNDFTNISIKEAKNVLLNVGSIVTVMLSRK